MSRPVAPLPVDTSSAINQTLLPLDLADRILLLCCRPLLDPERRQWLERTLETGPDWQRLIGKATYHRLLGLVGYHIEQIGALDLVPAQARAHLDRNAAEMLQVHQRQLHTLSLCLDCLAAHQIDVMLLKGPVLQDLYPPEVVRATYDLDLMVHEEDFAGTTAALQEKGFELETRIPADLDAPQAVAFAQYFEQLRFSKPGHTPVEIHFRLYNYGVPDVQEEIWQRARVWEVDGQPIPSLPPEELLLFLTTHSNLHAFGRILWYFDIATLYEQWREKLDWELIGVRARERKLLSSFYHSLLWINQLLYPERPLPELAPLQPSRLRTRLFEHLWRKQEVFALKSYIRPFDAAIYYLLGGTSPLRKLYYILRILFPSPRWLAAHLERPPSVLLNLHYLRKRRRENKGWNKITRKDELLR